MSIGTIQAQEPFIGEIRMFGGNFAPSGWAFCDGQLLPINQHQALFSLLGTTYGGDGRTTFGLPDLRGRFAMHAGNGPGLTARPQGQTSGSESHLLTSNNLPSHSHVVAIPTAEEGDTDLPNGNNLSGNGINGFKASSDNTLGTFNSGNTGGNTSVDHMPPYTTVRYIIALNGIFPSRS
ncbi:phage tail protein [Hanstruepera neustonica]|uniref:Phage tail protein n=2 Tax=Hanstruepera neustonica TaxID=1445657 RepID=A0A2K1DXQ8_9FLAO|nr:phage tail protein [Hanstruepera neustonica]